MALDVGSAKQRASELRSHAETVSRYKNSVGTMRSTIYDHWNQGIVAEIPELIQRINDEIDLAVSELNSIASKIELTATQIRNEEIRKEEEELRLQKLAAAKAAAQAEAQTVKVSEPEPVVQQPVVTIVETEVTQGTNSQTVKKTTVKQVESKKSSQKSLLDWFKKWI